MDRILDGATFVANGLLWVGDHWKSVYRCLVACFVLLAILAPSLALRAAGGFASLSRRGLGRSVERAIVDQSKRTLQKAAQERAIKVATPSVR